MPFSPAVDHAKLVLAPNLALLGIGLDVSWTRRGFMPEGGGVVEALLDVPETLTPLDLAGSDAAPASIEGVVYGRGETRAIADRLRDALDRGVSDAFPNIEISVTVDDGCRWGTLAARVFLR